MCGQAGPDGKVAYFDDWKRVYLETWNNAAFKQPDWLLAGGRPKVWDDYGGSYLFIARAAVVGGVDGGFPKAAEALDWMTARMTRYRQTAQGDPTFAISPRRAGPATRAERP